MPTSVGRSRPIRFHAWPDITPWLEWSVTNAAVLAGKAGDRLTRGLQAIIEKYGLPFVAFNQGSICIWKHPV